MATTATRRRAHEGRGKLPGPSSTALVHRTGTGAAYVCHTVTGACCFCVRRVLRPPSPHSACWPLLHACGWPKLRAHPAGDALAFIRVFNSTWWSWAERASCILRLRSSVRPRPQCHHPSRCIRAVGSWGSGPYRPRAALLCAYVNLFEASLVLCVCAALHDRVVRPRRPRHLAGGRKYAHKSSSALTNGLVHITRVCI
jgi:hypothetical protein